MRPPPVHLHAPTAAQSRRALAAVWRVLLDSERTEDILTVEELLAQRQLAHLLQAKALGRGEASLLRTRPEFSDVDMSRLAALSVTTLGGALAQFYEDNGISTKLYSAPTVFTEDADRAYLMRRIWQVHDVWHVLMNFTTRGHDEILVHAFSLAQTGMPSSVLLMLLGSLKHMLLEARWNGILHGLREAYERGKRAEPLIQVRWEDHLDEPLERLRTRYRIQPWTDADHRGTERWVWRSVQE